MRRAGVATAMMVVAALGLGCGELMAYTHTPVVPGMAARPDIVQLHLASWDWLRASATTPAFIAGAVLGVIAAETCRLLLRWLSRAVDTVAWGVRLVVTYRLAVAGIAAVLYYVVTYRVIA